jgi:lysophospholipase L1-like esterase
MRRLYISSAQLIVFAVFAAHAEADAPPVNTSTGTIVIVTMGDSLTDEHHWSNRKIVWHRLLSAALKAKYGGDVKIVNPAIGGTTLSQNVILMPRWEPEAPSPDLVTVWFGGNDWDLRVAVDRIREQTHGGADILLMTTCPGYANWESRAELEQAVRDVAKEKQTGVADVATVFRTVGSADAALKKEYWGWDKVHLGAGGHALTSDVVLQAIEKGD